MKAHELRALKLGELAAKLDDAYQELFNLRFQKASGQLSNPARNRQVRNEIARIKTILREQELAAEMVAE
ncbi:MAG: 50S ribosomal protein L29 [Chloroflexi bacterium]|nr:MAG: 50S ribosomal protein L29 [Chloroflexota bacterium]